VIDMRELKEHELMKKKKGRPQYSGYPYVEACEKSLCFRCRNADTCHKPDTNRPKNLWFKPIVECTNFDEVENEEVLDGVIE